MKTGENGINLLKSFEGCRLEAYLCPAKVLTIGYGHTGAVDGKKISLGLKITATQAVDLLKLDLEKFEKAVSSLVSVKLNQNQFDALVSFCYNVGAGNLKSSTLLKKLNKGDYIGAAAEFKKWNKGGGMILPGLVRRRKAETELFTKTIKEDKKK